MSSEPPSCEALGGAETGRKESEVQSAPQPPVSGDGVDVLSTTDAEQIAGLPPMPESTEIKAASSSSKSEAPAGTAAAGQRVNAPKAHRKSDQKRTTPYHDPSGPQMMWQSAAQAPAGANSSPGMVMLQPMMMPPPHMPTSQMVFMMPPQPQQFVGAGPVMSSNAVLGAPQTAMYPLYPFLHAGAMNFQVRPLLPASVWYPFVVEGGMRPAFPEDRK